MNNSLGFQLKDQIVRYIAGQISLSEFRNWFDAATWDADAELHSWVSDLIGEVELRLAEFSNEHLTEEELRAQLGKLDPGHLLFVGQTGTISGSSVNLVEHRGIQVLPVDKQPVVASW